jgi:hypothetical protein
METIIAATIAAIVTIIGATISFFTNRRSVRTELQKVEIELNRKLTEKLYDKRLEMYPPAFEITDALLGEYLFSPKVSRDYLQSIYEQLMNWHKRVIVLSDESLTAFQQLRVSLRTVIKSDETLSEENLHPIWLAKNDFRIALRRDLRLLYNEEQDKQSIQKKK